MTTVKFQVFKPVEEFFKSTGEWNYKEDKNIAFEEAAVAVDWATGEARRILECPPETPVTVTFAEFDSGNISHANAYYSVEATLPRDAAEEFASSGRASCPVDLAEKSA